MTVENVLVAAAGAGGEGLRQQLANLGYRVRAVLPDSPALYRALGEGRPDAVLVDLELPGDGGPATGQRLLELGIPVVYATDAQDEALLDASRQTDPLGYVVVPVADAQLHLTLQTAMATMRFRQQLTSHWFDIAPRDPSEALSPSEANEIHRRAHLMETVFNTIADGLVVADAEGNHLAVNENAHRITGGLGFVSGTARRAESYGLYLGDGSALCPHDDLPMVRALRGEATDDFPMVLRNPLKTDGAQLLVSARPLRDSAGAVQGALVIFRDVTAARRTEAQLDRTTEELRERTDVLENILNTISDGIIVADENSKFIVFNPAAERIAGTAATDLAPEHWSEHYGVFRPDQTTELPAEELPLVQAIDGKTVDEMELWVRNPSMPDGAFVSVNGRPMVDSAGNPKGGVVVFRDVTAHHRAVQAVTHAFAHGRLEVLDAVLHNVGNAINSVAIGIDTIAAGLANDTLRQRLAAVTDALHRHRQDLSDYLARDPQGQQALPFMTALVQDFASENAELRTTVERVVGRVRHIVDIIRTQKSFTDGTAVRKDVSPSELVAAAVNVFEESLSSRGIDVQVECPDVPELVRMDESAAVQMLVNLLRNAIEAIDERQRTAAAEAVATIRVRCYVDDEHLVIDVVDNGIGIEATRLRAIFAPGYTTKARGNGLGLHSAADFVAGVEGSIEAISRGRLMGTTMRVKLALAAIDASAETAVVPKASG